MDSLTVFCPFTRAWAVAPFFDALAASDVPRGRFVAYIDTDDAALTEAVRERATALGFTVAVHLSGQGAPDGDRDRRRHRHAAMREASKALVGDGPLLLLEDDTLIPPATFAHLSETLEGCDWAVGVEVGRWGRRPVGAWRVASEGGIVVASSLMAPEHAADATGLYCVLTEGALYRRAHFAACTLGVDIAATWGLALAGARLAVDWRVGCAHLCEDGTRVMPEDAAAYTFRARDPRASFHGDTVDP